MISVGSQSVQDCDYRKRSRLLEGPFASIAGSVVWKPQFRLREQAESERDTSTARRRRAPTCSTEHVDHRPADIESDERGRQERSAAKRLSAATRSDHTCWVAQQVSLAVQDRFPWRSYAAVIATHPAPRPEGMCAVAGSNHAYAVTQLGVETLSLLQADLGSRSRTTRSGGQPSQGARAISRGGMTPQWATRHGAAPESR